MPSTLRSLSLDTPAFHLLQSLAPESKRARSLAARSVVIAAAVVILDNKALVVTPPSSARKVSFTASMSLEVDEVLARLSLGMGAGPSETMRRALCTPAVVEMAKGVMQLDSEQQDELVAALMERLKFPEERGSQRESA